MVSIRTGDNTLQLIIPSQAVRLQIPFLVVWLIGWGFGEMTALGSLFQVDGFAPFTLLFLLFLIGWTLGGGFALYVLLWQLVGKEIIDITPQSLILRRVILGLSRPHHFAMADIRHGRLSTHNPTTNRLTAAIGFWGVGGGKLAFDYHGQTYHFGSGLTDHDAHMVLTIMGEKFPALIQN